MTHSDLARFVAERLNLTKKEAGYYIGGIFTIVSDLLESGETIVLHPIGRLSMRPADKRSPDMYTIKLKVAKSMKRRLAQLKIDVTEEEMMGGVDVNFSSDT
jgi:hypothetical protein